ncbi:MAG: metallophosphoesterase [Paracoccaceae bacterium]
MIYAVGDIHGYLDQLDRALGLIAADRAGRAATVVFLGDHVDRGPDSAGVVARLRAGPRDGAEWVILRGNHDRMFARFLAGGIEHDDRILSGRAWRAGALGGAQTLASYGVDGDAPGAAERARATRAAGDAAWLAGLPLTWAAQGHLFVHAGVDPRRPLEWQEEDDLIWIRDGFLDHRGPMPGGVVVHGHTPVDWPEHHGNRVAVDTGAGHGRELVPCVLDGGDWWALTEAGRAALAPAARG